MRTETTSKPLRELVLDFNKGNIQLPQFQRDYVWKPAKIRNLLDSLMRDFPIGGFYFWRPDGNAIDPKPKAFSKGASADARFIGYLIDGQQRLTSLEAAFGFYSGSDKHGDELRCFLDLSSPEDSESRRDTRNFVSYSSSRSIAKRVEAGDPTLIPVGKFFYGLDIDLRKETESALRLLPGWDGKRIESAMERFDRTSKMLDQYVPCTTILNVSDRDAVEIFSRLNKGGTQLRQADARAAELARGAAVDVLKSMREFASGERQQRLGFGFSFAFRALVVFHRETAQFNTLRPNWIETPGPQSQTLRASWKAAERALSETLRFADEEMGWSRRTLLPSANALIVLAAAIDQGGYRLTKEDRQLYRRWLCLTALRGSFQGSVETTMNRFLRAIKRSKDQPAEALVKALNREERNRISPEEFLVVAPTWGPQTQVMNAWLVSKGATDWLHPEAINALARSGKVSSPGGDLTVRHIFPREMLAKHGHEPEAAHRLANFAMVSRATNAELGKKHPAEVLAALDPGERKAAETQFFGTSAGDRLEASRYDEFLEWRAQRLAEALNAYLGFE
jgi:hypothetical protein